VRFYEGEYDLPPSSNQVYGIFIYATIMLDTSSRIHIGSGNRLHIYNSTFIMQGDSPIILLDQNSTLSTENGKVWLQCDRN
jgi:hypothetical protein